MAPKSKGKGKAVPPHQPKTLSSRVRQVAQQQSEAADEQQAAEQQQLIVPVQMAFTSLLSTSWVLRRTAPFLMVDCHASAAPIWRDSFCISVESSWLMPPLHKYLLEEDAEQPAEQLLVKFWQEHRFRERLQLGHRLLHEFGDVTGAATLLLDIAPGRKPGDWVTRIQMACAAYKHAWLSRTNTSMEAQQVQDGSLSLQDVRWLRAQWLLARTLNAALYDSERRTSGLLGMVLSAMIGFAPEDPMGNRFIMQRALAGSGGWEALVEVTEPFLPPPKDFRDLPRNPYGLDTASMASAYNRVLACYMAYGPGDEDTQAALTAALERDPARWVPVLLAGGALAVPGLPPLMALGSKEEASAYCREFGCNWWRFLEGELMMVMQGGSVLEQADAVNWLLQEAGLEELAGIDAGMSHTGVLMHNMNMSLTAIGCSLPAVVDEMNVRINGSMSVGTPGSTKPEEAPGIARSCLVLLSVLASSTQNLPPVDTCASSLWAPTARHFRIRGNQAASLKSRLCDSATHVFEIAQRLLAQCRIWQQQERRRDSQGNLDLVWPAELQHWERTIEELGPARARLLWQAGQVRSAKDVAAQLLDRQEQLHARLQSQLSSTPPQGMDAALAALLRGTPTAPGPAFYSLAAIKEMQEVLNQQAVEAARRSLSSRSRGSGARGGGSSHSRAGAFEMQFGRYEEATPEALQRFADSVLEAAGGAAAIKAALDIGGLLQAYDGGRSASWASDSEDEDGGGDSSDGDEDPLYGSKQAEVGIAVIEQLLSTPMRGMPARSAAGQGAIVTAAAGGRGLRQRGAAGSSSGGSSVPSIVTALRASLSKQPWVGAMGNVAGSSSNRYEVTLNPQQLEMMKQALKEQFQTAALGAVSSHMEGPIMAAVQAALAELMDEVPLNTPEDLAVFKAAQGVITAKLQEAVQQGVLLSVEGGSSGGGDASTSSSSSGASGGRVVRQRLLEQGTFGDAVVAAAAATCTGAKTTALRVMPSIVAAAERAVAGVEAAVPTALEGAVTAAADAAAAGTQGVPFGVAHIMRQARHTVKAGGRVVLSPAATAKAVAEAAAVAGSSSSVAATWDPTSGNGGASAMTDPGPGFVFGSSPDEAAAAASAAFDAVLQSYTGEPSPAATGPSSSSSSGPARQAPTQTAAAAGGAAHSAVLPSSAGAAAGGANSSSNGTSTAANGAAAAAAPAGAPGVTGSSSSSGAPANAAQGPAASQHHAAPLVAAVGVPPAPSGKVCACCGGTFPKLYRCSGCAAVGVSIGYCTAACQKAHWKAGHKKVCGIKAAV